MTLDLVLSPTTAALRAALVEVPLDATVTFAALTAAVGLDVTKAARSNLSSARHIALREDGVAFQSIRRVGLKRIAPDQAPEIGKATRAKIRRSARRGLRTMKLVVGASNGLSPEAQRALTAEYASLGLIEHITREASTTALVTDARPMPPAKAAQAFLAHIGAIAAPSPEGDE